MEGLSIQQWNISWRNRALESNHEEVEMKILLHIKHAKSSYKKIDL